MTVLTLPLDKILMKRQGYGPLRFCTNFKMWVFLFLPQTSLGLGSKRLLKSGLLPGFDSPPLPMPSAKPHLLREMQRTQPAGPGWAWSRGGRHRKGEPHKWWRPVGARGEDRIKTLSSQGRSDNN
jgi:hypothetical protein